MDHTVLHNISIGQFRNFFAKAPHVGMGDDFHIMDVSIKDAKTIMAHPCRIDGFMVIYCMSGHVKLNVNLQEYELKSGMLFLNYPGNIIRVNEVVESEDEDLRYICVAMSKDFVGGLMLDVNKIFTQNLSLMETPSICLDDAQKEMLREHLALMTNIVMGEMTFKIEAVRSILSSIFYFLAGVWSEKARAQKTSTSVMSGRIKTVFDQFIQLVLEYHTVYRNVGFYADRLNLTPKYLSRIIKEASGRSAPEWIDDYVVLEAKNLLKYSGLAIKEVVYQLNFPSQSVFYKFFKARTGMTPTEYKNL